MANRELPRRESASHLALRALQNIGGVAAVSEIMRVRDWRGTQIGFCRDVIDRLERCGLINVVGAMCTVSDAGRQYMGIPVASVPVAGVPVASRYVAPMRELDVRRLRSAGPIRTGALDYQNIPSRMGAEVVSYKGALGAAGETQ